MKITKAVITAAGLGTRFLPASKAFQKEMVPVMNKPQLHWVIEEVMEAGIHDIAIVCRAGMKTLENYLADDNKLWRFLKESGREELMDGWTTIKKEADITIYEQSHTDPYGNGTPFLLAKKFIGNDPIAALFGDDLMIKIDEKAPNAISQMISYYEKYNPCAVMAAQKVKRSEIHKYGCFEYYDKNSSKAPYQTKRLIEKPKNEEAPSLMANTCRFVLSPLVIEELGERILGKGKELWLVDAVDRLASKGEVVLAPPIEGHIWAPVGDPILWLRANLLCALSLENYRSESIRILDEVDNLIKNKVL